MHKSTDTFEDFDEIFGELDEVAPAAETQEETAAFRSEMLKVFAETDVKVDPVNPGQDIVPDLENTEHDVDVVLGELDDEEAPETAATLTEEETAAFRSEMLKVFAETDVKVDPVNPGQDIVPDLENTEHDVDVVLSELDEAIGGDDLPSAKQFWSVIPTMDEFWRGDWSPHMPGGQSPGDRISVPRANTSAHTQVNPAVASRLTAAQARLAQTRAALKQAYVPTATPETDVHEVEEILGAIDESEEKEDEQVGARGILGPLGQSEAFRAYVEKQLAGADDELTQHLEGEWRDWQIDFGPAYAPAGEVIDVYNNPQVVFRGEKVIATDSADPAGSGTRIQSVRVGQKVQRPSGGGSTLTTFFAANSLANGILWDTSDRALQIMITVSFVKACTFDATVFGKCVL